MIGTWGRAGMQCKIKNGKRNAGRRGEAICYFESPRCKQMFVVVHWDGDEYPSIYEADHLLVKWMYDKSWNEVAQN